MISNHSSQIEILQSQKLMNNPNYNFSNQQYFQQQTSIEDVYDMFDLDSEPDCIPKCYQKSSSTSVNSLPLQDQQNPQQNQQINYKSNDLSQGGSPSVFSKQTYQSQNNPCNSKYDTVNLNFPQQDFNSDSEDIFEQQFHHKQQHNDFQLNNHINNNNYDNSKHKQQFGNIKQNVHEIPLQMQSEKENLVKFNHIKEEYNSHSELEDYTDHISKTSKLSKFSYKSAAQSKKQVLLKHKIRKQKQVNINELDVRSLYTRRINIYKQNIKPQTTHICTNFMNIIVPYLIEFYLENYKCRGLHKTNFFSQECQCCICREYQELRKLKMNTKSQNISKLRSLWAYPRIRYITEDFILKKAYFTVINKKSYRSIAAQTSILLCLPSLQKGIQQPELFFKII